MNNTEYYPMTSSPSVAYDLFGYKNIESDTIPFSEQIKNAKDAKAPEIIIDFSNYKNPGDLIIISDNGEGMNNEELLNGWLNIGTNNKESISNALGGKGIGRFSLFRLSDMITVISKKKEGNIFKLILDKNQLNTEDNISQLRIPIIQLEHSDYFPNNKDSGTVIILEQTHYIDFNKIYLELYNIIEPGVKNEDIGFQIKIIEPKGFKLPQILDIEQALRYSNFNCSVKYKSNQLILYEFIGKINDDIIYKNTVTVDILNNFRDELDKYNKLGIDLGQINLHLHNFYFYNKFVSLNNIPQSDIQDKFLNIYQGISVYRQNFQIYGHGENDWLKLAEKRVATPSKSIDNKLTFGYISLTRPESDRLEETTNREGFISGNMVYSYFKESIELIINLFNKDRVKTIAEMKKLNYKVSDYEKNEQESKLGKGQSRGQNDEQSKKQSNEQDNGQSKERDKEQDDRQSTEQGNGQNNGQGTEQGGRPPKPKFDYNKLIDSSFECSESTPEKIKQIIYELQTIKNNNDRNIYSIALLLRCLIDISTQFAREILNLRKANDQPNLLGDIKSVINFFNRKPSTRDKHFTELSNFLNTDHTIKYLNGIVHDYDYRTTFPELKQIWNKFEFYINKCINIKEI